MPLTESAPDALARIYASSIFDLAKQHGGAENAQNILGELEDILEMARADARFGEFLASLILPASKREASLKTIFSGRVSDLTLRFLLVLNDKERLSHLPAITAALEQIVQESFGRVEVDVYTAAPIDQQELNDIRQRLQSVLKQEPVLHAYTDPKLIGGLRLQIGDQLIDASVATRLRKMRDQLTRSGGAEIRAKADRLIG